MSLHSEFQNSHIVKPVSGKKKVGEGLERCLFPWLRALVLTEDLGLFLEPTWQLTIHVTPVPEFKALLSSLWVRHTDRHLSKTHTHTRCL